MSFDLGFIVLKSSPFTSEEHRNSDEMGLNFGTISVSFLYEWFQSYLILLEMLN